MLELVKPSKEYLDEVNIAIAEYNAEPTSFDIMSVEAMKKAAENNFEGYFEGVENMSKGIGLKEGYVPSTVLWLLDNGRYIGTFDIRHRLTEYLIKYGGHIAYQIRPSERQKGYVSAGLKLCLTYAREQLGLDTVLICCDERNKGSHRTILGAIRDFGGREDIPTVTPDHQEFRYWVNTIPLQIEK